MPPKTRFTVEISADDPITTEVLTRQLRVDLRALGGLSLEPVFAPMPATLPDDVTESLTKSGAVQQLGVIAASGVASAALVKGMFDLLVTFVNRTTAGSVTLRRGDAEVTVTGVSYKDLTSTLNDIDNLLADDTDDA